MGHSGRPRNLYPAPLLLSGVLLRALTRFTGTANGATVDATADPVTQFTVQVVGTGAGASVWDVRLEGSLDGTNFTTILSHTNATGDKVVLWSGLTLYPSRYFRSRVAGLTLGGATNIVVTILGLR